MRAACKHTAIVLLTISTLLSMPGFAARRQVKSLEANANGKGTIKVGSEEFHVYTVVLKLKEGGDAEITLVSEITLFFSGTWANNDADKSIDLKISGGAASNGVQGTGKLLLRDDGKSIARLTLQGSIKARKTDVTVNFVAD